MKYLSVALHTQPARTSLRVDKDRVRSKSLPSYRRSVSSLVGFVLVSSLAACSAERPDAADNGGGIPPATVPACTTTNPREGCACATIDETAECGAVHETVGTTVVCSMGHATCRPDGTWGTCIGDRIVTRSMSALRTAGLGDAGACADPCTPGCSTTTDTPAGIVLPPGFQSDGGGLTVVPEPPPPNTCTGITIAPSTSPATDITVTSTTSIATKLFTSTLVPAGCNPSAPAPLWYTDKFDTAQMDSALPGKLNVVVPIAGPVVVGASLGTFSASVNANIIVAVQEKGTVNPPPVSSTFALFPTELATDPADANLEIIYPYTGTVFPLGLLAPLVQWRNGSQAADGGVVVTLQYPATGTAIFSISQLVGESTTTPHQSDNPSSD